MEKEQIINLIQENLNSGKISKFDLLNIANDNQLADSNFERQVLDEESKHQSGSNNLVKVFYIIGAIVILIGVIILVGQYWDEIGFAGRIFVTLGISVVSYVSAILMNDQKRRTISQILFTISAALAPLGTVVLLSESDIDFDPIIQIITTVIMVIIYGFAYFVSKRNILVPILTVFATWAYYASVFEFLDADYEIMKWATIVIGCAYIALAYSRSSVQAIDRKDLLENKSIAGLLYSAGTVAILGAGITIGGLFDFVLVLLIFGAFYGSIFLKSRSMLILGALFLVAHIIKITSEYFGDSFGWPILLIVIGFLVIGVGYLTFYLNRQYLSS